MSGLGRRSHYRKHLTSTILTEFPIPDLSVGEFVARVLGSRGGNIVEVLVDKRAFGVAEISPDSMDKNDKNDKNEEYTSLALLPTKFKNLVYIKRGDYVILQSASHQSSQSPQSSSEPEPSCEDPPPPLASIDSQIVQPLPPPPPSPLKKILPGAPPNTPIAAELHKSESNSSLKSESLTSALNNATLLDAPIVSVSIPVSSVGIAGTVGNKVAFLLKNVLFTDQIKHLKKQVLLWPSEFDSVSEQRTLVGGAAAEVGGGEGYNIKDETSVGVVKKKKRKKKKKELMLDRFGNSIESVDDDDGDNSASDSGDSDDSDYYEDEEEADMGELGIAVNGNRSLRDKEDSSDEEDDDDDDDEEEEEEEEEGGEEEV